jgi:hypothetical protein
MHAAAEHGRGDAADEIAVADQRMRAPVARISSMSVGMAADDRAR